MNKLLLKVTPYFETICLLNDKDTLKSIFEFSLSIQG